MCSYNSIPFYMNSSDRFHRYHWWHKNWLTFEERYWINNTGWHSLSHLVVSTLSQIQRTKVSYCTPNYASCSQTMLPNQKRKSWANNLRTKFCYWCTIWLSLWRPLSEFRYSTYLFQFFSLICLCIFVITDHNLTH